MALLRSMNIEGKCDICRARDRKNFKKRHVESKAKKVVEKLKALKQENHGLQLAIRELKTEVNMQLSLPAPKSKSQRPSSPVNEPPIKVEADEEPYSYDKLLEELSSSRRVTKRSRKEEAYDDLPETVSGGDRVTKRPRKGEADIGEWTPVNGSKINLKGEGGECVSTFTGGVPNSIAKPDSGALTFENEPVLVWT